MILCTTHGPEPQGLFSWEIAIEAGPRHSLEMRTSEAVSPNPQGSHRESDIAPQVRGGTRTGTLYSSGLRVCVSCSLAQAGLGKG